VDQELQLRPLRLDDWEAVHGWARLDEVCRYQAWGPNTPEQTYAFVEEVVRSWAESPVTRLVHAIVVNGAISGLATLYLLPFAQGEIAYSLHPRLWRQGIGTAAARMLLELGFGEHERHRIFGTCDPRNVASGRVLRRTGMSHEGRMRQNVLIRDGWRDTDIYSILRDEWRPAT
jgi:RimJ/RimL family protein N-acetyltransferase